MNISIKRLSVQIISLGISKKHNRNSSKRQYFWIPNKGHKNIRDTISGKVISDI